MLNQYRCRTEAAPCIVTTATTMVPAARRPRRPSRRRPGYGHPGRAGDRGRKPDGSAAPLPGTGIAADVVGPMTTSAGRLAVLRPADDGMLREVGHPDDLGVGEQARRSGSPATASTWSRSARPTCCCAVDLTDDTAPRLRGRAQDPALLSTCT